MKSTTGIKKTVQKPKETKVKNYRFWLVLSCAGLVGAWYVLAVLLALGTNALTLSMSAGVSPVDYDYLLLLGTIVVLFIASALSLPFAVTVFKKLKIQKPLLSAIALYMALVFGAHLFSAVVGVTYFEPAVIYGLLAGSMVFAGLLYGFVVRPLKHKLSNVYFLAVAIGLALLPVVMYVFWRLVVIKFL